MAKKKQTGGKDPAAVALGRKGGLVRGVPKGAAALSPAELAERVRKMNAARLKGRKKAAG